MSVIVNEKSQRPSVRLSEDELWEFVTNGHTGILTSLRRDGMPIAMPVWYAVVDRQILIRTRGKKLTRIANDPRVSFLVETGERWAELTAVHFTGHAEIIDADPDLSEAFNREIERKYAAYRTASKEMPTATRDVYRTSIHGLIRIVPDDRVLTWDNNKLGLG